MGLLVSHPRFWLGLGLVRGGMGLLQIRGSCSQGTLPHYNDKGLHLHEIVHLTAVTLGFAQWHCGE